MCEAIEGVNFDAGDTTDHLDIDRQDRATAPG